jgi:aminoglycoside/choline kinase family phosphotransferase
MTGVGSSVIGAYNEDTAENLAFFSFTRHFREFDLPVPVILEISGDNKYYLLTDLGDTTLFNLISEDRASGNEISWHTKSLYGEVIDLLPEFQIRASKSFDYSVCYPRAVFDWQSVQWDLNYFKYYFLRLADIPFREQELENDFAALCRLLKQEDDHYFLYRDFQSRNIMITEGKPFFIDYQGGRQGALPYDVASLLYDAKADLAPDLRDELLQRYLVKIENQFGLDPRIFLARYPLFILIRILQALGAYGFRGFIEKKDHFLKSIPFALKNLFRLRQHELAQAPLPELLSVIDKFVDPEGIYFKRLLEISGDKNNIHNTLQEKKNGLRIRINSFSYRSAIPSDPSGNGGGFVFDCRALPNPGRFTQYQDKTGRDREVISFLNENPAVHSFLQNVKTMVDQSITNYLDRGFQNLMVSFGCTGGRHRSVFCAEYLAAELATVPELQVELVHTELNKR